MNIDLKIKRGVDVVQTPRAMQLSGIFDVPPAQRSESSWHHQFVLPESWNIGVIVGPSGSGKTTLAREAFGPQMIDHWDWPGDKCILDGFPADLGIRDITGILSSVGFSSPPSWLRPFHALSNGEQFRVTVARTLAECPELAAIDEFTSVVDRQVAQIGSAAVAKAVRRRGQKFVAVTCHYDILDWLEPDWVYEPHTCKLTLNVGPDGSRGSLWRRPKINLNVFEGSSSAWPLFRQHHYLSGNISRQARVFLGYIEGMGKPRLAAFFSILPQAGFKGVWRGHRTVVLPDFQGIGIGNVIIEGVADVLWDREKKHYWATTASPAIIAYRKGRPDRWKLTRRGMAGKYGKTGAMKNSNSSFGRITTSWKYTASSQRKNKEQELKKLERKRTQEKECSEDS